MGIWGIASYIPPHYVPLTPLYTPSRCISLPHLIPAHMLLHPRARRALPATRLAPALHEHAFVREEYDEAKDLWTRQCECGFSETYEQM